MGRSGLEVACEGPCPIHNSCLKTFSSSPCAAGVTPCRVGALGRTPRGLAGGRETRFEMGRDEIRRTRLLSSAIWRPLLCNIFPPELQRNLQEGMWPQCRKQSSRRPAALAGSSRWCRGVSVSSIRRDWMCGDRGCPSPLSWAGVWGRRRGSTRTPRPP